jgi:hypothetical protein
MTWELLGGVERARLLEARLELHWAAQVVAASADGWLGRAHDDGHTAMMWDAAASALVGRAAPSGLCLALVPGSFELVARRAGATFATLELTGQTLAAALEWADRQYAEAAGAAPRGIHVRDYDMPSHRVRDGAAFAGDRAALTELGAWYACAAEVLAPHAAEPAPLRVWPHHFDLGTIIYLDAPGERAPQIGLGLSPGDGSFAEPYFYATPYPVRADYEWPRLAANGIWWRESWTGAVLTASALLDGDDSGRSTRAASFIESAIAASRRLIG